MITLCFILLTFRPSSAPSVTSTSKQTSSFSFSTASQPSPSSASKPAPEKEMAYVFILFLQNICLFVLRVQVIHFVFVLVVGILLLLSWPKTF